MVTLYTYIIRLETYNSNNIYIIINRFIYKGLNVMIGVLLSIESFVVFLTLMMANDYNNPSTLAILASSKITFNHLC